MERPVSIAGIAQQVAPAYAKLSQADFDSIPFRMPDSLVASIIFTPAPSTFLSDKSRAFWLDSEAHTWTTLIDDGTPDRHMACVREAVASEIFGRVGIACIPTYYATVNDVTGALKPLIYSTGTLTPNLYGYPDTALTDLIRLKIAADVCGLPDITFTDVFYSLDGRVAPAGLGKAFTAWGRHRLADPRFGETPPVWDMAANALPLIAPQVPVSDVVHAAANAFKSIPVSEWVDLLHPISEADPTTDYVEMVMGRVRELP